MMNACCIRRLLAAAALVRIQHVVRTEQMHPLASAGGDHRVGGRADALVLLPLQHDAAEAAAARCRRSTTGAAAAREPRASARTRRRRDPSGRAPWSGDEGVETAEDRDADGEQDEEIAQLELIVALRRSHGSCFRRGFVVAAGDVPALSRRDL